MIQQALILSLIITGVYTIFQQGMILGWLRILIANGLDHAIGIKWSRIIQKPIWDCLPCMAGVWPVLLTMSIDIEFILVVCGINVIIEKTIEYEEIPGR